MSGYWSPGSRGPCSACTRKGTHCEEHKPCRQCLVDRDCCDIDDKVYVAIRPPVAVQAENDKENEDEDEDGKGYADADVDALLNAVEQTPENDQEDGETDYEPANKPAKKAPLASKATSSSKPAAAKTTASSGSGYSPKRLQEIAHNKRAVYDALDTLIRYHETHPGSALGLPEMLYLLEGPTFQMREGSSSAKGAHDKVKQTAIRGSSEAVKLAVAELRAWVRESHNDWEAGWIMRDLKDAIEQAAGDRKD